MPTNYRWYSDKNVNDDPDAIHQILAYGNLKDIQEIRQQFGLKKLRTVFLTYPKKVYTPSGFDFISEFILHISQPIKEREYLKTSPRYTR